MTLIKTCRCNVCGERHGIEGDDDITGVIGLRATRDGMEIQDAKFADFHVCERCSRAIHDEVAKRDAGPIND